jgi:adenosylhomocysteine nucleosidase
MIRVQGVEFRVGTIGGTRVAVGESGVGTVNAARVTALVVERFHPRRIIATGPAVAAHPALRPGDIVLGERAIPYDSGRWTPKGLTARATTAATEGAGDFVPEAGLFAAARAAARRLAPMDVPDDGAMRRPRVFRGIVATGDAVAADPVRARALRDAFQASAVDRDGAAVAQVCEASGVACLVIRSIGEGESEPVAKDGARFGKIVAENSARMVVALLGELRRGALPAAERRAVKRWVVAYELAFGDATPYGREFPSLYDDRVPYPVKRAITRQVLDRITRLAARETKVRRIRLDYMPGAYKDYGIVPSAQLSVEGTAEAVGDFMAVVGYLAQQTEVIASTPVDTGGLTALRISQTSGRDLAAPDSVERFWKRLRALAPQLPGFSTDSLNGHPTLTVNATEGEWDAGAKARIRRAVGSAAGRQRLAVEARFTRVALLSSYNNWLLQPDGGRYLDRLSRRGRAGLVRRLRATYRPSVTQWITRAYGKYPQQAATTRAEQRADGTMLHARPASLGACMTALVIASGMSRY